MISLIARSVYVVPVSPNDSPISAQALDYWLPIFALWGAILWGGAIVLLVVYWKQKEGK